MFFGDLADLPVGDVLMGLERQKGTLIVTTNTVRIDIYLDNGVLRSFSVNDQVVTKARLVPKLFAKLLKVKQGEFRFEKGQTRPARYELPLPWLLIEAVGAMKTSAARRGNRPKVSRKEKEHQTEQGGSENDDVEQILL